MKAPFKPETISFWLYAAGLFTCTWDLLLKLDVGGFHLKIYQLFFLLGFLPLAWNIVRKNNLSTLFRPLFAPFPLTALALTGFYMGLSPWSAFPLKSFLYSAWLLFDIFALWLAAQHLVATIPLRRFHLVIWAAMLSLSAVILIDNAAYHLGRRQGLIGYNQDFYTNMGISRPHGFTSEPSFAAVFLCLGLLTAGIPILLNSRRRWLPGAGLLVVVFALIATTSRTGWAGLLFGFLLYFFLPALGGRRVQWKPLGAFALAIPVLTAIFYLTTPTAQITVLKEKFIGSLFQGNDSSGNSRILAHKMAYQMAVETQGLGVGLGASYKYFKDHGGNDYSQQDAFNPLQYGNELIMSTWGQLLAEGGIGGVLLFLLAAVFQWRALFQRWKADNSPASLGALSAAIVLFSFMAFWLGNVSRGDFWIWYSLWSAQALKTT